MSQESSGVLNGLTDGVKTVGDAEQRGGSKFILNGFLNLCVCLGINTACGLVLNKWIVNIASLGASWANQDDKATIFDKRPAERQQLLFTGAEIGSCQIRLYDSMSSETGNDRRTFITNN